MALVKARAVDNPTEILTGHAFSPIDYADAYRIRLPSNRWQDMRGLAQHLFERRESFPPYVSALLRLRDILVKPFGIQTAADYYEEIKTGEWIGFFRVISSTESEIILGDDDSHLDFRVSLLKSGEKDMPELTLTTVVRFNRRIGRLYFFCIKPFHKVIVRSMLNRAFGKVV